MYPSRLSKNRQSVVVVVYFFDRPVRIRGEKLLNCLDETGTLTLFIPIAKQRGVMKYDELSSLRCLNSEFLFQNLIVVQRVNEEKIVFGEIDR